MAAAWHQQVSGPRAQWRGRHAGIGVPETTCCHQDAVRVSDSTRVPEGPVATAWPPDATEPSLSPLVGHPRYLDTTPASMTASSPLVSVTQSLWPYLLEPPVSFR